MAVAVVQGKDIRKDLAIGPDFDAAVTIKDDEPAIDDGMRWMIDFNAAEGAGTALRMTLPSPAVDVLLVTGVAAGDQSTAMTSQLDAHRYTDGFAFIPPASPSNNTAAGRTPYQEPDPQQDKKLRSRVAVGQDRCGKLCGYSDESIWRERHSRASRRGTSMTTMPRARWQPRSGRRHGVTSFRR